MTDAEQRQGQNSDEQQGQDTPAEQPEQKQEGLLDKVAHMAESVRNTVADAVGEVVEEVVEVVDKVLGRDDDKRDNDDDDDDDDDKDEKRQRSEQAEQPAASSESSAQQDSAGESYTEQDSAAVIAREKSEQADAARMVNTGAQNVASSASSVTGEGSSEDAEGAEGAVFEPAQEGEGGRPRRIKDLEAGMEMEGRVTSVALYGIFVDVGVGRDGLVHISEMSDRRIETPTDLVQIGDKVTVRVKSVDPDSKRISLTMRTPRSEQAGSGGGSGGGRRRKRQEVDTERLSELKPGDLVEGTISGMAPFGAFVDIGVGKDGLVHVSELSNTRVERPEDAVSVGEQHTFRVLEVDPGGTRISLSLRRAAADYQERPRGGGGGGRRREKEVNLEGIEPGTILDGTVSGLAPFGAFVDVGVGRDGLVHISELSTGRIAKVEDAVNVGDKVQVRVLGVDPDSKRISLSLLLEAREAPAPRAARQDFGTAEEMAERAARSDRGERRDRGKGRRDRNERNPNREPEVYTFGGEEEDEEFQGNATLEDLLSKYGAPTNRRSKGRTEREEYEEEDEDEDDTSSARRRQRDAMRRTLDQLGNDE